MQLARACGGGVEFWIGLPIDELMKYMLELGDQVQKENQAMERASKRR
jgi:hypothetical protein